MILSNFFIPLSIVHLSTSIKVVFHELVGVLVGVYIILKPPHFYIALNNINRFRNSCFYSKSKLRKTDKVFTFQIFPHLIIQKNPLIMYSFDHLVTHCQKLTTMTGHIRKPKAIITTKL